MAFLQHPPRRRNDGNSSDELQRADKGSNSVLQSHSSIGKHPNRDDVADWSIVFPGRSLNRASSSSASKTDEDTLATPFRDHHEVDGAGLQLALPPLHDGTGRFTRPSSPSYAADDELERTSADLSPTSPIVPLSGGALSDFFTLNQSSDDDDDDDDVLDLNDADLATSMLFTESELGGAGTGSGGGNNEEARRTSSSRSRSRRRSLAAPTTLSSSSWAFMQHRDSNTSSVGLGRRMRESWAVVPPAAVLTSDEEDEVEGKVRSAKQQRSRRPIGDLEDEAAYEEAIGTAHLAQSAGIYARIPKRRHRKNGESEKGSKRSNTSDLRVQQQSRRSHQTRRSQTSAASAVRSRLGGGPAANDKPTAISSKTPLSKGEKLLNAILTRVFGVDDEEVLQAFLRDEGHLQLTHEEHDRGVAAALASRTALNQLNNGEDDVWSRNQRHRHLRRLLEGEEEQEADANKDDEAEDADDLHVTHAVGRVRHTTSRPYPRRSYVRGNVAEPSLTEALHATVLSGLRVVPSSLSILLAGSTSVRFVNYLVGRIGPGFTDRMRKLVDDNDVDEIEPGTSTALAATAAAKARSMRSNSTVTASASDDSSVRFAGSAHPAIAAAAAAAAATASIHTSSS